MISHSHHEGRAADRLLATVSGQGGGWMWLLTTARVANVVAVVLLPMWLGRAVDGLVSGQGGAGPMVSCAVLVAIIVVGDALTDVAIGGTNARATAWLRKTLIGHLLSIGPRATTEFEPGNLVSRVVGNAAEAGRGGVAAVQVLAALVPSVGSVFALLIIDPWLAGTFLIGLLAMAGLLRVFVRENSESIASYQGSQGRIASRLLDALGGARTIAAAGTVPRETERVLEPLGELRAHGFTMWRNQVRAASQAALVMPLVQVFVIVVAGFAVVSGRLTAGELFAASRYAALGTGIAASVGVLNKFARSRGGARRCTELLATTSIEYGERDLPPGLGRLQFRSVTVREGDQLLLEGVDLTVPPGHTLAVVGRSGAGKSVLAALAGRLRDPDSGQVLLDRMPLTTLDHRELREQITYAFERPTMIGSTINDALAMGRPLSEDTLHQAARSAAADDFIRRLPEGYSNELDPSTLSGGEVQRLGLARAFANTGRLLVLDDATSSLDTVTELQVSSVLTERLNYATRLIVAHRAATAARADLVAWLDGGHLRAMATHQQLWTEPEYRAVFEPVEQAAQAQPDKVGTAS